MPDLYLGKTVSRDDHATSHPTLAIGCGRDPWLPLRGAADPKEKFDIGTAAQAAQLSC